MFESLESLLTSSLPQEPTEWRRSYGRIIKSVHVPATFVPFSKEILPKEGDYHLIHQPIFHTYWTQCPVSFWTMWINYNSVHRYLDLVVLFRLDSRAYLNVILGVCHTYVSKMYLLGLTMYLSNLVGCICC